MGPSLNGPIGLVLRRFLSPSDQSSACRLDLVLTVIVTPSKQTMLATMSIQVAAVSERSLSPKKRMLDEMMSSTSAARTIHEPKSSGWLSQSLLCAQGMGVFVFTCRRRASGLRPAHAAGVPVHPSLP